jgi:hypothetical protein
MMKVANATFIQEEKDECRSLVERAWAGYGQAHARRRQSARGRRRGRGRG